jgi:hypothetical protein
MILNARLDIAKDFHKVIGMHLKNNAGEIVTR